MMIHGGGYTYVPQPPASAAADLSCNEGSSFADEYYNSLSALQRFLPSNQNDGGLPEMEEFPADTNSCDQFRMFEFKVRKCSRGRSHDWTECPFAHPGEKARRRDPRKFHYSAAACPEFRKGSCRRDDACEYAHGVFESWLHPARYRTQPCKDGVNCRRRVCFFAHSPDQLRVLNPLSDSYESTCSPPAVSPPLSPMGILGNDLVSSMRRMQLSRVKSMPLSWMGGSSSPTTHMTPPKKFSLPSTPTRVLNRPLVGYFDAWEATVPVESGRDLRVKMFEKLSKENPLNLDPNPDVGWVADLVEEL